MIAVALPSLPSMYTSGADVYLIPGEMRVNESMIHCTSFVVARLRLYPKPALVTLTSETNPLVSRRAIAVAPNPSPETMT